MKVSKLTFVEIKDADVAEYLNVLAVLDEEVVRAFHFGWRLESWLNRLQLIGVWAQDNVLNAQDGLYA